MKRLRRRIAILLVSVAALLPLPGCTSSQASGMGALLQLGLAVGASVGTYYLIKELD